MKLWLFTCIVSIGFACFEGDNSFSGEISIENDLDADISFGSGSWESDEDDSTPDRSELPRGCNSQNGFTDCPAPQPRCDPNYPYRTMNGTCNNLGCPSWGAANQCFQRYERAFYTGSNSSRRSVTGEPLPNPRNLSVSIFENHHHPTKDVSFMFTIYGQTVAHDISLSQFEFPPGERNCCAPENLNDPACMSIAVSPDDPFYSKFNVTCLELFRTVACNACNTDKRQQITTQTAAMDASIVYGPSNDRASQLRTNDGTGRLLFNDTTNEELLPSNNNPNDVFCPMSQRYQCFVAGDPRVNQHALLTSVQTLIMREHNRIAVELKKLNPNWDDERLYQEARRITIAEIQYINFQEYLPNLLGKHYMKKFGLYVKKGDGYTKYNPDVRFGVWNEFSTGPFRLHSMIATDVGALNLTFRNLYSNPALLWEGDMRQLLNGVCKVPSEEYDRWFVYDATDFLFQTVEPYGSDLAALDIQRGRDHGLAPYVNYLKLCSGDPNAKIRDFKDLEEYGISKENIATLSKNYKSVEDIDFYVGLQLEKHEKDTKVGPTAACIIAQQFHRLKYGDRFYFEHTEQAGSFTAAQRASIKQTSLSRILCDNTNTINIQRNALLLPSVKNPKMPCSDIPRVNLLLWKEKT